MAASGAGGGGGEADNVTFLRSLPADSILRQLKVKTLEDFKKLLRTKGIEEGSHNYLQSGAVILQRLIINKFKKNPNIDQYQNTDEKKRSIVRRLNYFKSSLFIKNFLTPIGTRESLGDKINDSSYSDYYDTLFNVRFTGWRDKKIIKASNQTQCKRALGEEAHGNNMDYSVKNCYICGIDIVSPPHETAECEHVLPIMSAISHLWLTQERIERYTPAEVSALKLEYAWAHECCNQIKSNYEFIQLNYPSRRYEVNMELINAYYTKLYSSATYDCGQIEFNKDSPSREALFHRIRGITEIINKNIIALDSNLDIYHLLVKFKMISAFTDRTFLSALIGVDDDTEGELPVYGSARFIDPEARRAQMIKNKEEEIKIRQAEDPRSWKYNPLTIERRRRMAEAKDVAGARIMGKELRKRYVRVTRRPVREGLPVRIAIKRGKNTQGGGGGGMKGEGEGEGEGSGMKEEGEGSGMKGEGEASGMKEEEKGKEGEEKREKGEGEGEEEEKGEGEGEEKEEEEGEGEEEDEEEGEGEGEEKEEEEEEGEEEEGEEKEDKDQKLLKGERYLSDYRSPFDEDLTFRKKFLRLVGVPQEVLAMAETDGIPHLHKYIIEYIIHNDEYNPTQAELDEFILQEALVPAVPPPRPAKVKRVSNTPPPKKRRTYPNSAQSKDEELNKEDSDDMPETLVYGGRRTRKRNAPSNRTKTKTKKQKRKQKKRITQRR